MDDNEEIKSDANSSSDQVNESQLEPPDLNLRDSNRTQKEAGKFYYFA